MADRMILAILAAFLVASLEGCRTMIVGAALAYDAYAIHAEVVEQRKTAVAAEDFNPGESAHE